MISEELIKKVTEKLINKNLTISAAESCTGGLLSHYFTYLSGSSDYFERGVISYSNNSKSELLKVKKETIEKFGAVSDQTAKEMAEGIKKLAGTDIGISTTGIAGPTGGTKEKPVGLVFIGISYKKNTDSIKFIFNGNRLEIKEKACEQALKQLFKKLV